MAEEEWEDLNDDSTRGPYLKVVVEVTERDHDGYCSEIEEDENEDEDEDEDEDEEGEHTDGWYAPVKIYDTTYRMIGAMPLKDEHGASWDFLCGHFDPGWDCASGGSSVCGVRPSVRFLSMERIN